MTTFSAFVALEPSPAFSACITKAKTIVLEKVGPQKYLHDPPHLTIQVGCFPDLEPVADAMQKIAERFTCPFVELGGWHVYPNDPLTNGHTVVTAIQEVGYPALRALQARILQVVAPLRDADASRLRYKQNWVQLGELRQRSVNEWGFPFTGSDWQPHVTVGSILPEHWDIIWPELLPLAPHGVNFFSNLVLYSLDAQQTPTKLVSFPFVSS